MNKKDKKPFLMVVIVIFLLVMLFHFIRLSLGWDILINGWNLPTEVSGLISILSAFLIYWSWLVFSGSKQNDSFNE